jgi:sugar/nucleoside kinase (ribokinase family)
MQPGFSKKAYMNKEINNAIPSIIDMLDRGRNAGSKAFIGFDACIDNIVRVVREKDENNDTDFFSTSRQFGEYLISHENKSCGIELRSTISKPGGNMVITGNALGKLGITTDCAGTFGLPDILPFFRSISSNCNLHTIGDTITATALEFNSTKVILFDPGPYNNLSWDSVKAILRAEQMKDLLKGKQLISFLNWSEILNSTEIWEGFLKEIVPASISADSKPLFFTDLSDCSRRTSAEICEAIKLLAGFRNHFRVVLSLNHNEADLIAGALGLYDHGSDEVFIKSLFKISNTNIIIIHRTEDAVAFDGVTFKKCDTFLCSEPAILTGGGDNFNAGFCLAQIRGMELFNSLLVANAVSGYYVKTGLSPDIGQLITFLAGYRDSILS